MHGGKTFVGHGPHSQDRVCGVATNRGCARELTLRCAAEVTDVWIPVRVCRTFQTRDFLCTMERNYQFRIHFQSSRTAVTPPHHTVIVVLNEGGVFLDAKDVMQLLKGV